MFLLYERGNTFWHLYFYFSTKFWWFNTILSYAKVYFQNKVMTNEGIDLGGIF